MSTFEIITYTDTKPHLKLDSAAEEQSITFMGKMGADGDVVIPHLVGWANQLVLEGDIKDYLTTFFNFAKEKYFFPDQDSIWADIRYRTSNEDHKVMRPHDDGSYWSTDLNNGREQFKVGTCLVGPGTLFWSTEGMDEEKTKEAQRIGSISSAQIAEHYGQEIPAEYKDVKEWQLAELKELGVPIVTIKAGECVRWVVGDNEKAAIHSEPDMSDMPEGRFFVMMLPGTEAQIRDLAKRWKKPFQTGESKE